MAESPITRDKLIKKLNEDLAREYQAIIAYVVYSQMLKGAEYMNIADELELHAKEELQHALKISKHIDYLGGTPTVSPAPVKVTEDAEEMLRADLDNENRTVLQLPAARERVRGARRVRDCGGHPGDPASGAGTPNRSRDSPGRGRA